MTRTEDVVAEALAESLSYGLQHALTAMAESSRVHSAEAALLAAITAVRGPVMVTEEMVERALFAAFPLIRGKDGNPDDEDRKLMRYALEAVCTQLPPESMVVNEAMVARAVAYWRSHYVTSGWPGLSLDVAMTAVLEAALAPPVEGVE